MSLIKVVGPTSSVNRTDLVGESHLVADDLTRFFAYLLAKFSSNALCNRTRCNTARLGVPDHAGHAPA